MENWRINLNLKIIIGQPKFLLFDLIQHVFNASSNMSTVFILYSSPKSPHETSQVPDHLM